MLYRKFVISCPVFFGFEQVLLVEDEDTHESLIKKITVSLEKEFKRLKLAILCEMLANKKYHIHTHTIQQILYPEKGTEGHSIYICCC